jgi:hypothetical protein
VRRSGGARPIPTRLGDLAGAHRGHRRLTSSVAAPAHAGLAWRGTAADRGELGIAATEALASRLSGLLPHAGEVADYFARYYGLEVTAHAPASTEVTANVPAAG